MKCSPLTTKAVLFDLGNTLVYSHPEVTFQRILVEHGIAKPLDEVADAMIRGNAEFDIERHEGLSAHEFYTRWNIVHLKHLGVKGPKARKLAGTIDSQWWKYADFHVYSDVRETLLKLKKMGLKLGIVTGGFEEDIEMIMPKIGLGKLFDVKVGVNTTGERKPSPKAFRYALKKLKLKPNEAVFVGDNFKADYEGAEKVGMIPVLIKRKSSPTQRLFTEVCSEISSETRTIEALDEVFEVLKTVNA
jgi:putative hydrolase of the HAD superfamily